MDGAVEIPKDRFAKIVEYLLTANWLNETYEEDGVVRTKLGYVLSLLGLDQEVDDEDVLADILRSKYPNVSDLVLVMNAESDNTDPYFGSAAEAVKDYFVAEEAQMTLRRDTIVDPDRGDYSVFSDLQFSDGDKYRQLLEVLCGEIGKTVVKEGVIAIGDPLIGPIGKDARVHFQLTTEASDENGGIAVEFDTDVVDFSDFIGSNDGSVEDVSSSVIAALAAAGVGIVKTNSNGAPILE